MKVVNELKQHVGEFTGRLVYLWDSITDLGYSTSGSSGSPDDNTIIVYGDDGNKLAEIEIEYTGGNGSDDIKVISIS